MTIPRDLGSPFDPTNPIELAEFEGFGPDVPNSGGMAAAVAAAGGVAVTHTALLAAATAQSVRAAKLFSEGFLRTVGVPGVPGVPAADFPTPDLVTPDVVPSRSGAARDVEIFGPIGTPLENVGVEVWSFADPDPDLDEMWPAPTIRVVEGKVVHTLMNNSHGPHTIHHHGIEPTPANDGVGHLTFEVGGAGGGDYSYQWKAGEAGTYFYHCHRNTVLHFEMGMYGMLIIDPDVDGAPFPDGGPGYTLLKNDPISYDKETFWVVDDIDVHWRSHDKDFGMQSVGANPVNTGFNSTLAGGLNDFLSGPHFFVVTGVTIGENGLPEAPTPAQITAGGNVILRDVLYGFVQPSISQGQNLLIRATNASYCTTVWRFPVGLDGTVVAIDGRTLGRPGFGSYSYPFRLSDLPLDHSGHRTFSLTTAQRWDILINTDVNGVSLNIAAGTYNVLVEFRHWNDDYDILQRADASTLQTVILPVTVNP